MSYQTASGFGHDHAFLGVDHQQSERRTWWVICLCGAMMALEIAGGMMFGSIALVADGLHMSTHAGALLLAAIAYRFARKHVDHPGFSFGTGKVGDLAGFASAIILGMIALAIGYEAAHRLLVPVPIRFGEAIPIAWLGLAVNVASTLILAGGVRGLRHGHAHPHHHDHDHDHGEHEHHHHGHAAVRDNNMRAAMIHVAGDAAVSALVIIGLSLAEGLGWMWMDPAVGIVGALVIGSWAFALIRDTGRVLLDMTPDHGMARKLRAAIETDGDELGDLHLWRVGPGHLAAIVSVSTRHGRDAGYYRARLAQFQSLSHLTVEVHPRP